MRKDRRRIGFGHGSVGGSPHRNDEEEAVAGLGRPSPAGVPHVVEGRPRRPYGRLGSFLADADEDMPRERTSLFHDDEGY